MTDPVRDRWWVWGWLAATAVVLSACGSSGGGGSNPQTSASPDVRTVTNVTEPFDVTFTSDKWHVREQDRNSVLLDGSGQVATPFVQMTASGSIQIASATSATPTTIQRMTANWMDQLKKIGTSVRACENEESQVIGGISGKVVVACYLTTQSDGVMYPEMETFWRATNASGTITYMVWTWTSAYDFHEFEEMATGVINTIRWKLT